MSLRDHRAKAALKDWAVRQSKVGKDPSLRGPWVERREKRVAKRVRTSGKPKR